MRASGITVDIMDNQLIPPLERIERHARAHGAKANESDFHSSSF
jgi:hypothetical protein